MEVTFQNIQKMLTAKKTWTGGTRLCPSTWTLKQKDLNFKASLGYTVKTTKDSRDNGSRAES